VGALPCAEFRKRFVRKKKPVPAGTGLAAR
jgi:hypothetical protein